MWELKKGTEDNGRWKEYINSDTGESSIKEHKLKTIWISCPPKKCYYELTNPSTRECTCTKCGSIYNFVLGMQILQNGKIVNLR